MEHLIRQTVLHTRRRGFELTPAPRQKPRDPSTPRPSSPAGIGSWIDGTASHSLPPHSSVSACVPTSGQHQQTTQGKPNHPPESPVLNLSRPIHPPARDKGRPRSQPAPRAGRLRALGDIYPISHCAPAQPACPRARNNIRRAQETPRHRSGAPPPLRKSAVPTPHVVGAPQQLLRWLASSSSCARSATARPAPARDRTACGQCTEFTSPCLSPLLSSPPGLPGHWTRTF